MDAKASSFTLLAEEVGTGSPLPPGWAPLSACDCLILVGLTGVGKSTTLAELYARRPAISLLPDRRQITDQLMIPTIQEAHGVPQGAVTDRAERFAYTRQYRQRFPGGMAHALGTLAVAPRLAEGMVVFDGLRGENEIRHATEALPQARFLMLEAPDAVRLRRLLTRGDAFDQVSVSPMTTANDSGNAETPAMLGDAELAEILTATERDELVAWIASNGVAPDEVVAKARIILAEHRNYDPAATREALVSAARKRALILDTQEAIPAQIAERAAEWLCR